MASLPRPFYKWHSRFVSSSARLAYSFFGFSEQNCKNRSSLAEPTALFIHRSAIGYSIDAAQTLSEDLHPRLNISSGLSIKKVR